MQSTRERIIQTLFAHPRSTIIEIAREVGINAISVRHHITNLQATDMVTAEEERHGVGRPRMVYSLTDKGMEHFPTSYLRLTNNLLYQLKQSIAPEEIKVIFKKMAEKTASEYQSSIENLGMEQKLDILKQVMQKEGFNINWRPSGDHYIIDEIACPYFRVGIIHPEVCVFDKTLIANILSLPTDKITTEHISEAICSFIITP